MTRRENHVRRRPPSRQPRTRVLVVCGGVRTEPDYFNGLKQRERNPAVHIKVIGRGIDPEALVRHALQVRAYAADDFDEVWCVTDVDDFRLEPAVHLAQAEGISLAVGRIRPVGCGALPNSSRQVIDDGIGRREVIRHGGA